MFPAPRRATLKAIADALEITVQELRNPVPSHLRPRVRRQDKELKANPEPDQMESDPDAVLMDEWRRQGMLWRYRVNSELGPQGKANLAARARVVELISEEDGLDRGTLEALIFVAVSRYCLTSLIDLSTRPHEYPGRALALRQIIDDAECVAKLLLVQDNPPPDIHAWQIQRDTNAAELREIRRAVERWEQTYAVALDRWAGVGPAWDPGLDRNLFLEACCAFDAFSQVLPPDNSAFPQALVEKHFTRIATHRETE